MTYVEHENYIIWTMSQSQTKDKDLKQKKDGSKHFFMLQNYNDEETIENFKKRIYLAWSLFIGGW